MELAPRLIETHVPSDPEAAVLVMHGGASRGGDMRVSPTQLSVLRMIPIARHLAGVGRGRLAVFRLLNSRRGWNTTHTPVKDAAWALDEIGERLGPLPVGLVGHSLGGRAAILSAGHPRVDAVAALAPWVYPSDVPALTGTPRFLLIHGSEDRIASPRRSAALADRLAAVAPTEFVLVEGAKHAMLRSHSDFSRPAAQFTLDVLLG